MKAKTTKTKTKTAMLIRRDFAVPKIKVPKAADVLAAQLRKSILEGKCIEGEMLPAERELAELSGLSRSSVREAIRILENEGLLNTRPGRNGGSAVSFPSRDTIVRSVRLFISSQPPFLESLLQARTALEPAAAKLAAQNRTEEDIAAILSIHKRLVENIEDLPKFLKANLDWHLAVVHASHNDILIAFMESVSDTVYAATNISRLNPIEIRNIVVAAHAKINDAIVAGDADPAQRRMERHVKAYSDRVQQQVQVAD